MTWGQASDLSRGEVGRLGDFLVLWTRGLCLVCLALWLLWVVWLVVNVPVRPSPFDRVTGQPLAEYDATGTSFYKSEQWLMAMLPVLRILLPVATSFGGIAYDNYAGFGATFLGFGVVFAIDCVVFIKQAEWWGTCNNGATPRNPCNDHRWCAVWYAQPNSQCGNTSGFWPPVTYSMLLPDFDFQVRFFVLLLSCGIDFFFGVFSIILWVKIYGTSVVYRQQPLINRMAGVAQSWLPGATELSEFIAKPRRSDARMWNQRQQNAGNNDE